jgi:hypothetical protein
MIVIHSYAWAVVLAVITMLCWGSWANTQKLATKEWPFQLFYWDYSIGVLLLSLLLAFTAGSVGTEGRSFIADLSQADFKSLSSAFFGWGGVQYCQYIAGGCHCHCGYGCSVSHRDRPCTGYRGNRKLHCNT